MSYVSTAGGPEAACVFCAALASGDDRRAFILHRGKLAFLILNAFPYASGHLMAVITRHVPSIEAATAEELGEAMVLIQTATRALGAVYHPDGLNVGLNQGPAAGAGVVGHLHIHLVRDGPATPTLCRSSARRGCCPKLSKQPTIGWPPHCAREGNAPG